jgi:hypothetical protein
MVGPSPLPAIPSWGINAAMCDAVSGSEGEGIKAGEGRDVGEGATNLIRVRGEEAETLAGPGCVCVGWNWKGLCELLLLPWRLGDSVRSGLKRGAVAFTLCRHIGLGASLGRSHRPQGAAADESEEGRGGVKPVTLPVGEAREVDLCRAGEREGEGAEASGGRGERVWRADLRQGEQTRGEEEGGGDDTSQMKEGNRPPQLRKSKRRRDVWLGFRRGGSTSYLFGLGAASTMRL